MLHVNTVVHVIIPFSNCSSSLYLDTSRFKERLSHHAAYVKVCCSDRQYTFSANQ